MRNASRTGPRRTLAFAVTWITWTNIGPWVFAAIAITAVFSELVVRAPAGDVAMVALFGAVAMGVAVVPGSILWRRAFRREVLEPLEQLGAMMARASGGDLTARSGMTRADEIGTLAEECDHLVASLAEIAGSVRTSADQVAGAAGQLSASSQEMSASSVQISSAVQQIAHGAELQSRKVEETTAAMESITRTVGEVARRAEEASATSEVAAQAAMLGEQATAEAIGTINEVRDAMETLAESVEVLSRRSAEIGGIVGVITSIADQTNLLSLNAAIEAARAGEYGRGFAVVADEVRKLAEGSGRAAEQIGDLIGEVQVETAKAVRCMEAGSHEIARGTAVVDRTGETLRQITSSVTRTSTLAEEIAAAMAAQAQRTVEVDRAMHDIAAVVEENAASAQQTAAAAEEQTACMQEVSSSAQELAEMARRLDESVHRFQIGGG